MTLWCVVADAGGAHEAECVYSIWSTKDRAELEIARLKSECVDAGCYGGEFYVVVRSLDESSNDWIQ